MIKGVRVINPNNESVLMKLDGMEQGPFSLWSIEGLDQGEADIHVTEMATMDGAVYNSSRQNSRELTITALLNWPADSNHTIQWAREQAYKYFPLKKKVKIVIYLDDYDNGGVKAFATEGYVKENVVDIFAKQCAARATIIRTDPFFYKCIDTYSVANISGFTTVELLDQAALKRMIGMAPITHFKLDYCGTPIAYRWFINDVEQPNFSLSDYMIRVVANTSNMPNTFDIINSVSYKEEIAYFDDGSLYYSVASPAPINNGEDVGMLIEIPITTALSYTDLFSALRRLAVYNIDSYPVPTTVDDISNKASGYITLNLSKIIQYPDFAQDANNGLKVGDIIRIYTQQGQKDIRIYISAEQKEVSLLNLVDLTSINNKPWPIIHHGTNNIIAAYYPFQNPAPLTGISTTAKIIYKEAYRGI